MKIKTIGRIQIIFGGILCFLVIIALFYGQRWIEHNGAANFQGEILGIYTLVTLGALFSTVIIVFVLSIMLILQGMVNEKNENVA